MRYGVLGAAYLATYLLTWTGVGLMTGLGAWAAIRSGRGRLRERVGACMDNPAFWYAFWFTVTATTVNTLWPLTLYAVLPVLAATSAFLFLGVGSLGPILFCAYVWRRR